jgi:hypothetical protein
MTKEYSPSQILRQTPQKMSLELMDRSTIRLFREGGGRRAILRDLGSDQQSAEDGSSRVKASRLFVNFA